ncbi:helix-turn-helix transcriptional regulator [Neorhizobium sp. SHOUNA12A]|uniref:helix-turn-helix transcriptional regulator n=1 Tax=Neorhizobium sp. SHOUNA12A TaxID=2908923 RepID=UPI0025F75F89|nr:MULTISPECIES: helix-turn-helix transcriptional regulator [unclassified Neorhizobium]
MNTPEDLGRMVRHAREERRLTQQAFADLAGVGRRFISELENGKTTLEFDKVLKVARAAGISCSRETADADGRNGAGSIRTGVMPWA